MPSPLALVVPMVLAGAAGFVSLRLYARRLSRSDSVDPRCLRRVVLRGTALFGAVGLLGLLVAGSVGATRSALSAVGVPLDGPTGTLSWLPTLLAVVVVVTVTYLGAFPVAREHRDADVSAREAAAVLVRWQLGVAFPALIVAALVPTLPGAVGPAAAVVAVGVGFYAASPWIVRLSRRTWVPDERAARLARLCKRAGVTVPRRFLLAGRESERAAAFVRGPPGFRTLFVTDYLLEAFDDERAAALLVAEAGRPREVRTAALVFGGAALAALGLLAVEAAPGAPGPAVALPLLTGFLGLAAAGRRLIYRADERAARRVGSAALVGALEAVRETQGSDAGGRLHRYARATPPIERRIERLRGTAGDDGSGRTRSGRGAVTR